MPRKKKTTSPIRKRKVACYGSCIRPKYWSEMWTNFTENNDIEFEMIMVGHIFPDFEPPKNMHHVFSKEKPSTCVEIARRIAHASDCKYMLNFTDDYYRLSDNFLDKLVEDVEDAEKDGIEDYITCAMFHVSPDEPWDTHDTPLIYHNRHPDSPQLHTWMFHKTETSIKWGSIDKMFMGQYWDVDLQMRNYQNGGIGGQQKAVEMTERRPEDDALGPRCAQIQPNDRQLLDGVWDPVVTGKRDSKNRYHYSECPAPTKRLREVVPYTDENLNYLKDNNLSSWQDFWKNK